MTDLDVEPRPRRRRWPWIALAAVVALLAAFALWWRLSGTDFVYRGIQPEIAELLRGHEIPEAPGAGALTADLRLLGEELPRRHADFADAFDPDAFRALLGRLAAEAPEMTPIERQMALLRVLASGRSGTGHTMVVPLQRALDWRHYGLAFYDFADGLHVVTTAARHGGLEGAKVLAVGGVETAEALARLAPYAPGDNAWSRRQATTMLLGLAEPLTAVGLADADGRTTLIVDSGDGPREVGLEPFRLASLEGLGWALRVQDGVEDAWSPADPHPRRPGQRIDEPVPGVVVLRIDAVRRDAGGGPAQVAEMAVARARALDEAGTLRRFVVDLRSNEGGDNTLARGVVDAIAGDPVVDRRGVLYVLIGRRTFSAAGNLAAALERRTRATFAGEPTGSAPLQWGDTVPLLLPGTKVVARVATRLWLDDLPGVRRRAIEPDLAVPLTARDHFGGQDPALAAILAHEVDERAVPDGAPAELPAGLEGVWLASPLHRVTIRAAGSDTGQGGDEERSGGTSPGERPAGETGGRGEVASREIAARADPADGTGETPEARAARSALPWLEISTGEPFAATDLHPLGGGRWGTDIRAVELLAAGADRAPVLRWKGRDFPLRRAPDGHRLPLELLRGDDDAEPEVEPDPRAAAAAFRAAAREVEIDSDFELAINSAGYGLLRDDRAAEAVELFRLNAELFPASANVWDSLGDGLRGLGEPDAARDAYRRALDLDPTFEHSRRQLAQLDREGR